MARKPDYAFERRMRDRNRAAKKAARLEAKRARKGGTDGDTAAASDGSASAEPEPVSTARHIEIEPKPK